MGLILVKFIVGGLVITAVTALANRLGGRVGGVLSGFPAIFTTVYVLEAWGHPAGTADALLITIVSASIGAIVANGTMILAAPRALIRMRFGLAVILMLSIWAFASGLSTMILPG
ncbi:DUF3147 family protein [Alicyclobacillus sp. SO9]|uniref:DUF3147 family protein n=1 Tax=Alicyclobacillus sp. SO9 TaxID=2665646 RepID=UPI0018E7CB2C|nr:DUF3147 family protein [Alicyclobacillus sp. SO9]QQE78172.1 DUF3147 family protein [Alicyclobacillus sp. SO9]